MLVYHNYTTLIHTRFNGSSPRDVLMVVVSDWPSEGSVTGLLGNVEDSKRFPGKGASFDPSMSRIVKVFL